MFETMQNIMGFDIYFAYKRDIFNTVVAVGVEPGVGGQGAPIIRCGNRATSTNKLIFGNASLGYRIYAYNNLVVAIL